MKATREKGEFRPVTIVIETQEELDALQAMSQLSNTLATKVCEVRNIPRSYILDCLNSLFKELKDL